MQENFKKNESPAAATFIKIRDAALLLVGKNLDKAKLNEAGSGLPYIVGASSMKDSRLFIKSYCDAEGEYTVSILGDVLVSIVGTLGKMAVNNIGPCILSRHVCAVRFVSDITPEYGLICLQASLALAIEMAEKEKGEEAANKTGFSKKLDADVIGNIPLCLITVDVQRKTVDRMLQLAEAFELTKDVRSHTTGIAGDVRDRVMGGLDDGNFGSMDDVLLGIERDKQEIQARSKQMVSVLDRLAGELSGAFGNSGERVQA